MASAPRLRLQPERLRLSLFVVASTPARRALTQPLRRGFGSRQNGFGSVFSTWLRLFIFGSARPASAQPLRHQHCLRISKTGFDHQLQPGGVASLRPAPGLRPGKRRPRPRRPPFFQAAKAHLLPAPPGLRPGREGRLAQVHLWPGAQRYFCKKKCGVFPPGIDPWTTAFGAHTSTNSTTVFPLLVALQYSINRLART